MIQLISLIASLAPAAMPNAVLQDVEEPKVSASLVSKAIAPSAIVRANVKVEFAFEMHGYQNPPMRDYEIPVKVSANPAPPAFKVQYPKGIEIDFLGDKTLAYEGQVVFPISFKASSKIGANSINVEVFYQQCNKSSCFPPKTIRVKLPYNVVKPKKQP